MSASPPAVSVIVLTYNARAFISDCLEALRAQSFGEPFEVIVVDNASADGTAAFVRERFPHARVIESSTNGGYGAGNNLGAAHASGETLAFLNPDAIPEPDWLRNLIDGMRTHGCRFATSKIVLQSNHERLNSGGNLIHYLGLSFCRGLNAPRTSYMRAELVSGASGAACAISRDVFERIGGFDPTFFLYHDDVDLSLRALLAGEACLYVPEAVVAHDYELSVPPAKWGWVEAHRYAVLLKAFRARTLIVLLPALLALDCALLFYFCLRGREFVLAKLRSYAWVARHLRTILAARRRAQAVRVTCDREILKSLTGNIPYQQLLAPPMSSFATWFVDPWFRAYQRLSIALVS